MAKVEGEHLPHIHREFVIIVKNVVVTRNTRTWEVGVLTGVGTRGYYRLPLVTTGYYWLLLVTTGYYWLLLVTTGYYW